MALDMNRKKVVFGLILVVLGLLLLGRTLDLFYFTFGELSRFLLAFGFIILGVWLIIRKKSQEDRLRAHVQFKDSYAGTGPTAGYTQPDVTPPQADIHVGPQAAAQSARTETGGVKYSKLLGDLFIDCANVNLQNVEISTGVGDAEVKLHDGRLSRGLNRMIISGFVGDVRLFVPKDMPFYIHSSNFIGDIDIGGKRTSGFSNSLESQSADYDTAESKLYIAVNNFIGDIRLFVV